MKIVLERIKDNIYNIRRWHKYIIYVSHPKFDDKLVSKIIFDVKDESAFESELRDISAVINKIHSIDPNMPVILMTAFPEIETAIEAIKGGAYDFILKPFVLKQILSSIEKAARLRNLIKIENNYKEMLEQKVKDKTNELSNALQKLKSYNEEIVHRLTAIAEYRDTDTGKHTKRIGLLSQKLAKAMNLPLSTVHYNLQLLLKAGLVSADNYHYSEKGKEVLHYKLSNKYVIIAPKKTDKLKGFVI